MVAAASNVHRAAHWLGVILTLPILAAVIWGLEEWLRGEFPPMVTIDDVSLVLMMAAAAAALVYLICRAIGWIAAAVVTRSA
jgi:hypothetical protein